MGSRASFLSNTWEKSSMIAQHRALMTTLDGAMLPVVFGGETVIALMTVLTQRVSLMLVGTIARVGRIFTALEPACTATTRLGLRNSLQIVL